VCIKATTGPTSLEVASTKWLVVTLTQGQAESLVYVHYNLRLLSHYCEEAKMDKNLKHWDNNPKEHNLEDGVFLLEQLENALLDDDDRVELRPHLLLCSLCPESSYNTRGFIFTSVATVYIYFCTVSSFLLHYHHKEVHTRIVVVEEGWDSCFMFLLFHYFICHSLHSIESR
jgi:hypothetical protein